MYEKNASLSLKVEEQKKFIILALKKFITYTGKKFTENKAMDLTFVS